MTQGPDPTQAFAGITANLLRSPWWEVSIVVPWALLDLGLAIFFVRLPDFSDEDTALWLGLASFAAAVLLNLLFILALLSRNFIYKLLFAARMTRSRITTEEAEFNTLKRESVDEIRIASQGPPRPRQARGAGGK